MPPDSFFGKKMININSIQRDARLSNSCFLELIVDRPGQCIYSKKQTQFGKIDVQNHGLEFGNHVIAIKTKPLRPNVINQKPNTNSLGERERTLKSVKILEFF